MLDLSSHGIMVNLTSYMVTTFWFCHSDIYVRKRTCRQVRPVNIQISLRMRTDCSETLLIEYWIAKDAKFLPADNKDSNQTVRMHSPI